MGFLEDIDKMELSDEQKQALREGHQSEVDPLKESVQSLNAKDRRESVEAEVTQLSDLGFENEPGLLKFYRRALLSDDSEPGLVLLTDEEMGLSGDNATGAKGREEISTADTLRKFVGLLPRDEEGKVALSDQALASESTERPEDGGEPSADEKREERKKSTESWLGEPVERTRSRYSRRGRAAAAGGGA